MFAILVKKSWSEVDYGKTTYFTGWFFLGFIPLYIRVSALHY